MIDWFIDITSCAAIIAVISVSLVGEAKERESERAREGHTNRTSRLPDNYTTRDTNRPSKEYSTTISIRTYCYSSCASRAITITSCYYYYYLILQWARPLTCCIGNVRNVCYGRFPWFQSSKFQIESLKSERINCGCFFDAMSDSNVPGSRP